MKKPYYLLRFTDLENQKNEWKRKKYVDILTILTECIMLMNQKKAKGVAELYRINDGKLGVEGRELMFKMVRRD